VKTYILRGACAGVIAALATALTLLLLGEPSIRDAIELEEAAARASGEVGDDPMFSRTVQLVGGSLGVMLYGTFIGTIFGVVYAAVQHRLGAVAEWKKALRLAGLGFLSVYLVPFLKYPPNPPAVGDPDTVNERTIAYLCLMAIGIITSVVAVRVGRHLRERGWPEHVTTPAAVALWIAIIGLAYAVMPGNPDEIAVGAKLIWRFRLASLGGQAAFWAACGLVFGWLTIMHTGRKVFAPAEEQPVGRSG
jgi:predicted cobalt transporter CbtA